MRDKTEAVSGFMKWIERSWTWERLTEEERAAFREEVFHADEFGAIFGNYEQRWRILNWLYSAFLAGCGCYGNKSLHWRQLPEEADAPRF